MTTLNAFGATLTDLLATTDERSESYLYGPAAAAAAVNGVCKDSTCEVAHCRVCTKRHAEVACMHCLHRTRQDVEEIVDLTGRLMDQALEGSSPGGRLLASDKANPGGQALLLAMPHANPDARAQRLAYSAAPGDNLVDEDEDQTPWEWMGQCARLLRDERGTTSGWLDDHLAWASEHSIGFPTLAEEARAWAARLRTLLGADDATPRTPVRCADAECDGRLEWRDGNAASLDGWECAMCGEWYRVDEPAAIARHANHDGRARGHLAAAHADCRWARRPRADDARVGSPRQGRLPSRPRWLGRGVVVGCRRRRRGVAGAPRENECVRTPVSLASF